MAFRAPGCIMSATLSSPWPSVVARRPPAPSGDSSSPSVLNRPLVATAIQLVKGHGGTSQANLSLDWLYYLDAPNAAHYPSLQSPIAETFNAIIHRH